jgi:hypothetical protein
LSVQAQQPRFGGVVFLVRPAWRVVLNLIPCHSWELTYGQARARQIQNGKRLANVAL